MKKQLLAIAALATIASGAAFAADADPSGQFALQINGSRTRAEVQAEAVAAVQSGATQPSAAPASSKVQPVLASNTTRAQVTAEYLASREEANAMTGEDSGSTYLAKATRAQPAREYFAVNAR